MLTPKLVRASEGEPNRCTATFKFGQCPFVAYEGTNRCAMHHGPAIAERNEKREKYMYRAAKWSVRIQELANDDQVKTLREEIGVSRMMLEEVLNKCDDATELLLYSTTIMAMISTIQGLVVNCTKLEDRLGMVLDKSTVMNLAEQISQIISEHVYDEKVLDSISFKIQEALASTSKAYKALEYTPSTDQ